LVEELLRPFFSFDKKRERHSFEDGHSFEFPVANLMSPTSKSTSPRSNSSEDKRRRRLEKIRNGFRGILNEMEKNAKDLNSIQLDPRAFRVHRKKCLGTVCIIGLVSAYAPF
jgi:hypothetical protein